MPAKVKFRQRIAVLVFLILIYLVVVAISKHFSPAVVTYVVQEALIQKAPEGVSPAVVRERFEALLQAMPPEQKLIKMLDLSNYLEKVQKLTSAEMDQLMAGDRTAPSNGN